MAQFEAHRPHPGHTGPFENGQPVVANDPIIPFIRGDGTGVDIWPATQKAGCAWPAYSGAKRTSGSRSTPAMKPATSALISTCRRHPRGDRTYGRHQGPLTTQGGGIRSLNALRQIFDLYCCVRLCRYYEGTPAPQASPGSGRDRLPGKHRRHLYGDRVGSR